MRKAPSVDLKTSSDRGNLLHPSAICSTSKLPSLLKTLTMPAFEFHWLQLSAIAYFLILLGKITG